MRVIELLREHSWKKTEHHSRRIEAMIISHQPSVVEKATRLICTRCNLMLEVIFWSNGLTSWYCFNDSEDYLGAEIKINLKHIPGPNYIITGYIYGEQIHINCRIRAIKQALG